MNYRNEDGDEFYVKKIVYSKPNFTAGENIASKWAVVQHPKGYEYETSKYGFPEIELLTTLNDL